MYKRKSMGNIGLSNCCNHNRMPRLTDRRVRRWTFTFYDSENVWGGNDGTGGPDQDDERVRYFVAGFETCPETGRDHWQGYIEFSTSTRLSGVQAYLGAPAHCEPAERPAAANRTYCTKEGNRTIEFGTQGGSQGQRTDLTRLRDDIRTAVERGGAGAALAVALESHPGAFFMYPAGIRAAIQLYQQRRPRNTAPIVEIHQGSTGTGKTRQAYARFPDLWRSPPASRTGTHWFDGYVGQHAALIDDYDGRAFGLSLMLQMLDRYPLSLPVKGGFTSWSPDVIIFTTNVPYDQWYEGENAEQRKALQRRITKVVHYKEDGEVVDLAPDQWQLTF